MQTEVEGTADMDDHTTLEMSRLEAIASGEQVEAEAIGRGARRDRG